MLFEREFGRCRWAIMLAAAALAISVAFVALEPHRTYRGLSGLDCAAWAAGLVVVTRRRPLLAGVLAAVLAAKLVYEAVGGAFIFPQSGWGDMGLPVMSAHWMGALVGMGLAVFFEVRSRAHEPRRPQGGDPEAPRVVPPHGA